MLYGAIFPSTLKKSLVLSILKKTSLDADTLSSLRPISNLSFLSKLVERVVFSQIGTYLTNNNLYPRSQSSYRKHHSTEAVLLKVMNDIEYALDDGLDVALVLVDLSSAFDTVDHQILLERLQFKYFPCTYHLSKILLMPMDYIQYLTRTTIKCTCQLGRLIRMISLADFECLTYLSTWHTTNLLKCNPN